MAHVELPPDAGTGQDLTGAGSVFKNRSFVYLWSAQTLSQLASNMVLAALIATVVTTTGSLTANAVLILTFLVPAVLFSTLGGVLVERGDAKVIMLASNIARAVGTILFIFVAPSTSTAIVPLVYLINFGVATATAVFAPAELTSIPRIVERRHLMAANSIFILTINATFAIGFGFVGPLVLNVLGSTAVYVIVAVMFALSAAAIVPLPSVKPDHEAPAVRAAAGRAVRELFGQLAEGVGFIRANRRIAWSLTYLGVAASLIGVLGAIGPGFATDILLLRAEDFFFIMGPAGLGAVVGILFLNSYGKGLPKRLAIDIGLVAMGVTLIALALVRPITALFGPALSPIEDAIPSISPFVSLIAVVVVIAVFAGLEYAFVAIPSQTALQEELPREVRGRIFGILNTLLSVASFLPVIAAPAAADVLNILFPGAGIPVVMAALGLGTLWAGIASWRRNSRAGLHEHDQTPADPVDAVSSSHSPAFLGRPTGRSRRIVGGADALRPPMAVRLFAAALLLASAIVAWFTITVPPAARALQFGIALSMAYVAWLAWRGSRVLRRVMSAARSGAGEPTGLANDLPFVSLIVPARNEEGVIDDTVRSLGALRYHRAGVPAYEVLVVDDGSTDATGDAARGAVTNRALITVRRRERGAEPATKGAALAFATPFLSGDVIGVIDADTRVEPAFLERAMRAWRRDPAADALQVARVPRNASASWLTRSQAEEQLMDMASQCGRWVTDGTAELRGNGMFVRRAALEASGGWSPRALTEDLELSTRMSAYGRHVTLAPEAEVGEEAVETLGALWHQRLRWAEGSLRRLLEHGPGLLAGSEPMSRKADFLAFTGEFLIPPLFVAAIIASLVTIPMPQPADWTVPVSLFIGYGLGVFLLALAGLWAMGARGFTLVGRATRGALFLSHWLVVVPVALVRIAFGSGPAGFVQTPRAARRTEP